MALTASSGKSDHEVQLYAFDILAMEGDDLRPLPLSMRKAILAKLLHQRPDGIFTGSFEHGEIGPELFRHACMMGLEGLVSKRRDTLLERHVELDQGQKTTSIPRCGVSKNVRLRRPRLDGFGAMPGPPRR